MGTQEWNLYTPYKLTQNHTRFTNIPSLYSKCLFWIFIFIKNSAFPFKWTVDLMHYVFLLKIYKKYNHNHPQNTKQMLEILFIGNCVIGGHQPNIFQIFYNNLIFSYYCPQSHPLTIGSLPQPPSPLISFHLQILSIEKLENKRMFVKITRQTYQTIYHVALLKNCSNFLCNVPLFSYSLKNVCNITPRKICIHL